MISTLIFFLIIVFTCCLIGLFPAEKLVFLLVIESSLFLISLVTALWLRSGLSCRIEFPSQNTERKKALSGKLVYENHAFLPVSFTAVLRGISDADNRKFVFRISGLAEQKDIGTIPFQLSADHCGVVRIQVASIWCQDILRFFTFRKKVSSQTCELNIMPENYPLHLPFPQTENLLVSGQSDTAFPAAGDDVHEIYQLREYKPGDVLKNMHWNLSAKTDALYVKEFSRGTAGGPGVFLDLLRRRPVTPDLLDAFYTIVSAVVSGLSASYDTVEVSWYDDKKKEFSHMKVSGEKSRCELLAGLYRTAACDSSRIEEASYLREISRHTGESYLKIDFDLRLSSEKGILKQFSLPDYERELAEDKVVMMQ